jgi:hypothetical protein
LFGAKVLIGEALGGRNAGGLQPPSKRERQHERVVPPLPGVLVIALAKADLTKPQPPVEGHCGGVVATHLKDEALRPSPFGGARELGDEPAGNAVAAVPLMDAQREKLDLIGSEPPEDETNGLRRARNARQEGNRAGVPQQLLQARFIPGLGKDQGVQRRKLSGVPWRGSEERQVGMTERRGHGQARRREGSAGGLTSGGLR